MQEGVVTSPEFPGNYLVNLNCTYKLEVPEGYRMEVTFDIFNMEPANSNKNCAKDYIIIRDGGSEASRLIGKFCGGDKPKTFLSSGRFVWIFFVSDDKYFYNGFKATFRLKSEGTWSGPISCKGGKAQLF